MLASHFIAPRTLILLINITIIRNAVLSAATINCQYYHMINHSKPIHELGPSRRTDARFDHAGGWTRAL